MKWLQAMVNTKIHQVTPEELERYAKPFDLSLTHRESETLARILKQDKINFFNKKERAVMLERVEKVLGSSRAKKLDMIVQTFLHENKL